MQVVYFKTDTSGPVGLFCPADERIDFSELGSEFGFVPTSIILNGVRFRKTGLDSRDKWETMEEVFKEGGKPVGTEEDPVIVTGEAPVSTEGDSPSKKIKRPPDEAEESHATATTWRRASDTYFKTESSPPASVYIRNGRIDFSVLGDLFELDPTSIALNETMFPRDAVWEEMEEFFKKRGKPAGTKEDPVVVTGKPRIHGTPTGSPDEAEESHAAASTSYFNELLEAPGELPSSVEDLRRFLSQIPAKLPLDKQTFYAVNQPELVTVSTCAREKKLAAFLQSCFFVIKQVPGNDAQSSHYLSFITGDFLKFLDENAPVGKQVRGLESILDASNPSLSRGTLSALEPLKRPDFQLFVSEVLLLRWENRFRAEDRGVALDENVEKLKVWSPLYYGELPYVIGGCCGGRLFEWLKLSPRGKEIVAEPISVVYELNKPSGGALFLHSIIRMHCLLRKLQDKLTSRGPAVRLYKAIPCGDDGGLVTFYPDFVRKEVVPALSTVRTEELQSLYDAIKGSRYLIQLGDKIRTFRNKTVLKLQPVGDPLATPCGLEQLKNAMHDLLHALEVLHKADYTHRDLRWPNCIRVNVKSEWKWVLIDLEYGGRDGAEWEGDGLVNWDAGTLEVRDGRKVYTKRSDMYELGKLILQWLASRGVTEIALGKQNRSLWRKVRTQGEKMQKERAGAAQMLQEICPKNCARCAKFLA